MAWGERKMKGNRNMHIHRKYQDIARKILRQPIQIEIHTFKGSKLERAIGKEKKRIRTQGSSYTCKFF